MTRLPALPFLTAPETVTLMTTLGEARFVGGVVRNALLGRAINDIDVATPLLPNIVRQKLEAAGVKAVPTGIEHGTITAVVNGQPFEVTTLRRDVETDGRRAVVSFTADWAEDAERRDFTMNALYADLSGEVFDSVGGIADLEAGRVRFVGDPVQRIREDYLRILRYFRFYAWYGTGPLDADAVYAADKEKKGLARLSGERIAKEMLKLLEAENPLLALSAMAETGILAALIPAEPDLMRLRRLAAADAECGFAPDGLLRLAALLPRDKGLLTAQWLAARWKLSNAQRERLVSIAAMPADDLSDAQRALYRLGPARYRDLVRLAVAGQTRDDGQWRQMLRDAEIWQRPHFPLTGADVMALGVPQGPAVGKILAAVEAWWIDNGFGDDANALHNALQDAVRKVL